MNPPESYILRESYNPRDPHGVRVILIPLMVLLCFLLISILKIIRGFKYTFAHKNQKNDSQNGLVSITGTTPAGDLLCDLNSVEICHARIRIMSHSKIKSFFTSVKIMTEVKSYETSEFLNLKNERGTYIIDLSRINPPYPEETVSINGLTRDQIDILTKLAPKIKEDFPDLFTRITPNPRELRITTIPPSTRLTALGWADKHTIRSRFIWKVDLLTPENLDKFSTDLIQGLMLLTATIILSIALWFIKYSA